MPKKQDNRTEKEKRSYTMSRIRGKATTIEVLLQKALWHKGVRYRKNYRKIPGSPDIAIVKYKIAIFCDGEFWHGKDWEQKKARLKNNREYWIRKIERNIDRDNRFTSELQAQGWYVLRFWEEEIKTDIDNCVSTVIRLIASINNTTLYQDALHYEAHELLVAEQPEVKARTEEPTEDD
jgi:DNA mismatch endonuclease (patch repair protein)